MTGFVLLFLLLSIKLALKWDIHSAGTLSKAVCDACVGYVCVSVYWLWVSINTKSYNLIQGRLISK